MESIAISNTSCLIALERIGQLEILTQSFNQVLIPEQVRQEFGKNLPGLQTQSLNSNHFYNSLLLQVGPGEAAAIALAAEVKNTRIILDDRKARNLARKLGFTVTGTIGVILLAKKSGTIRQIAPVLQKLEAADFHLSPQLKIEALKLAGEHQ